MGEYKFEYDSEDDVLYIQNSIKEVEESVEVSEDIVIDLDKEERIIGIEIFYASEFLSFFNKEIDKKFLDSISDAHIEYKEFRNNWFISLVLRSGNRIISQIMPPLRKSEYVSPLIVNSQ